MSKQLPKDWNVAKLEDVATLIMGQSPPSKFYNTEQDGLPFFQGKAEFGDFYPEPVKWCTQPSKVAEKEDILISVRAPVGPTNLAPSECCIGRGLAAIRPSGDIPNKYVLYYIRSIENEIEALGTGTTFKAISGKILKSLPVPIAPLEQQKSIVAEIEKQFSRLDEAVANLKRVKANLKRYKAAVLKAAVEGKLTEEWRAAHGCANVAGGRTPGATKQHPDVEPASKLLERILTERRQKWEEAELAKMKAKGKTPKDDKWKKKYMEPETLDTTNLPELPVGWKWVWMDSLIVWGPQNGLYLPKTAYKPGIAILRIDDYQDGHSREVAGLQQVNTTEENVERYGLELNDFVINRVNSPSHLGKCIVIKTRNLPSLFESNMMRLKLASSIRAEYVELYFHSKSGKIRLIENAKWAVNQASINQGDVSMTAVPLPPENEQELIINEVGSRFAIVTSIEAALEANMRRAERLRQSILSKAFSAPQQNLWVDVGSGRSPRA